MPMALCKCGTGTKWGGITASRGITRLKVACRGCGERGALERADWTPDGYKSKSFVEKKT